MAEENQVPENQNEQTEYEVNKPLLDAFKALFKRPAALPGEIPSKHKTTNIDMRTSMSFREFSAKMMKSVGNFFQSISKIGSSKKEENLNKIPKESISSQNVEQNQTIKDPTIEIIRPITVAEKAAMRAQQVPTVGTISIDETVANDINKAKNEEGLFESDSSTDGTPADADIVQEPEKKAAVQNVVVMAEMTVNEPINEKDLKSKTTTIKRKDEPDQRDF